MFAAMSVVVFAAAGFVMFAAVFVVFAAMFDGVSVVVLV